MGVGFLARCTSGLEWVSVGEIKGRLGATIVVVDRREIFFELPNLNADVLCLNTVDDVFLNCGFVAQVDHTRASLAVLVEGVKRFDFLKALNQIRGIRKIRSVDRFDVVCSFVGRRNYNRYEVEVAVGGVIAQRLGATQKFHEQRVDVASDVSWRVHIRNQEAYVGLRIAGKPLHRRAYKVASKAGTLHPPIASAMALLSGLRMGGMLLDPCCGFGTLPIEALQIGADVTAFGCDIDPSAIALAKTNVDRANKKINFAVGDAGRLPFAYRVFDRIVCNLPWEQAVKRKGYLKADTIAFWKDLGRTLHSEGRAVVLSLVGEPTEEQLAHAGLRLILRQEIRVFGRWANLSVVVPEANRDLTVIDLFGRFGCELDEAFERYATLCQT